MTQDNHKKSLSLLSSLAKELSNRTDLDRVRFLAYAHLEELSGWVKIASAYQGLLKSIEKKMQYGTQIEFNFEDEE